jgi:hypothetical protein
MPIHCAQNCLRGAPQRVVADTEREESLSAVLLLGVFHAGWRPTGPSHQVCAKILNK